MIDKDKLRIYNPSTKFWFSVRERSADGSAQVVMYKEKGGDALHVRPGYSEELALWQEMVDLLEVVDSLQAERGHLLDLLDLLEVVDSLQAERGHLLDLLDLLEELRILQAGKSNG